MDRVKAELLATKLAAVKLEGWTITRLINHGKSAAVFLGKKAGTVAAVKVFDSELIERYGDKTQLARIERELELRGTHHENLVSIYGGGFDDATGLHYIIMEYVDGQNLKDCLHEIDAGVIPKLISQLATAAKFLESRGLVHRDIKPENIVIVDGGKRLILLDFGVIRPVFGSDLTDPEGIHAFIGTLQYSSPEFLLREEVQDIDGFRAITFYQIGAVLHDLLLRKPIFEQFANPFAKLVNAVQHEKPSIVAPDAAPWLVQLAQRCLLKSPVARLRVVNWDDFTPPDENGAITARDRVEERLVTVRAQSFELPKLHGPGQPDAERIKNNVMDQLKLAGMAARTSVSGLPPVRHSRTPDMQGALELSFKASSDSGLPHGLAIRVAVEVIDAEESVIACTGCAFLPQRPGVIPPLNELGEPWFEGALDNVAMLAAFQDFFFEAVEWGMQISPAVPRDHDGIFTLSNRRVANG